MMAFMNETPTGDLVSVARTRGVVDRIAANVRAELARAEVSPATVAELLRVHPNTVTARLAGRSPFYAHEIVELAQTLGVTAHSLLYLKPDDPWSLPPRGEGPGYLGPVVGGGQ